MPRQEGIDDDCDRCDEQIDGFRVMMSRDELERRDIDVPERWDDREEFPIGTAGYYRTGEGKWADYTAEDEEIVCDDCMSEEDFEPE